jgi:site-specific DNA-cytosine methylase
VTAQVHAVLRAQYPEAPVVPYDLLQVTEPRNFQNRDENSPCHTLAKENAAHAGVVTSMAVLPLKKVHGSSSEGAGRNSVHGESGDPMFTLDTDGSSIGVLQAVAIDTYNGAIDGDVTHSIRTAGGSGQEGKPHVLHGMSVRRLTPEECERLQGFPDNHTRIPWKGKSLADCPDGPRYRALGNSMAVPVIRWIGRKIDTALKR